MYCRQEGPKPCIQAAKNRGVVPGEVEAELAAALVSYRLPPPRGLILPILHGAA